jgi:hypothetical protein
MVKEIFNSCVTLNQHNIRTCREKVWVLQK